MEFHNRCSICPKPGGPYCPARDVCLKIAVLLREAGLELTGFDGWTPVQSADPPIETLPFDFREAETQRRDEAARRQGL